MQKINSKTDMNIKEIRKQKIPEYKHTLKSFRVDNDLYEEIEKKTKRIIQEKNMIEKEIAYEMKKYEELKINAEKLYDEIYKRNEKVQEESIKIQQKYEELEETEFEIKQKNQGNIEIINKKLNALKGRVSHIEFVVNEEKKEFLQKKKVHDEIISRLENENNKLKAKMKAMEPKIPIIFEENKIKQNDENIEIIKNSNENIENPYDIQTQNLIIKNATEPMIEYKRSNSKTLLIKSQQNREEQIKQICKETFKGTPIKKGNRNTENTPKTGTRKNIHRNAKSHHQMNKTVN